MLASFASSIGTMVDGIVIGQCLGVDSIAAFGVISPLMIIFALSGAIVSSGARNRFTRLVGEGEIRRAQGVFSMSCLLAVGMATLMMVISLVFATPISRTLGATGTAAHLLPKARMYLIGIAIGLPGMNAMRILNAYMPIDNDRNLPIITSITVTVVDIVLDLLAVIASSAAIAAYSVHRQADSFLNPITFGLADTVAMLAGVLMGEENRPMLKRLHLTSAKTNLTFTLGIAIISWVFAPQFAALYIKGDPEALAMAIRATRCYALGMPLYGLSLSYFNYFQGIGKSRLSSISGFLSESGFLMLSASVLSRWYGADAVWYAFPVTQVLMFLYFAVVIKVNAHKLGIQKASLFDRILLVPEDFDAAECDRLDRSITTRDEVATLSQEVWDFCDEHGCDPRRRYLMSLSVEEMAGNVIAHGFTKDKKKHSIDVRILKKGDDYIVRIRDDCVFFDPIQRLQLYSQENPTHHMGIRMIMKSAKDVMYTNILKLNNLVVRV